MQRRFPAHPLNAPGPFYVINGECIACGAPESEAPALISHDDVSSHCFFARQPTTDEEVDAAIRAMWFGCVQALRYSGGDPTILRRLGQIGLAAGCDNDKASRFPVILRKCVNFTWATPEQVESNVLAIIRLLSDSLTRDRGNHCSSLEYAEERGSFSYHWGSSDRPYSMMFRVESRSDRSWLVQFEGNDIATLSFAIRLDMFLRSSKQVDHIRWFAESEIAQRNSEGSERPY
jgi:hypothetical protein